MSQSTTKAESPPRQRALSVYLGDDEYDELREDAWKARTSMSRLARGRIVGLEPDGTENDRGAGVA